MGDWIFLLGVFGAGVLSFFSPCILPLLPVYVSYLSGSMVIGAKQGAEGTPFVQPRFAFVARTLLFVFGLSVVFVLLGFGSGVLGNIISSPAFIAVCGTIVVLFGIYQTGLIRLSWLERERKLSSDHARRGGYLGAFILGLTFSFGWTPCIGPVLAAILGIAAGEGSPVYGGFLMCLYTLGLAIPFLFLSVFSDYVMKRIRRVNQYMSVIKIGSGCILIVMGVFLMTDRLNNLISWFQ
ncbi:cytochrome c biogenesis protein CcdA [Paenibacillus sp. JGP012]|uniref:cytochrome c biogenesis CcdA family protein n=1 Tax=Paenibacillus sp. JGP012 TaxID=2735914 RepID=UPI0017F49E12|nr:cytochrome c biogenesis protein CcdA [Paenibacillus sp. JGP012]MBB6022340.1 cytochrome c biogenesis protein CcdA [Paenibacillus sp. JGP012]